MTVVRNLMANQSQPPPSGNVSNAGGHRRRRNRGGGGGGNRYDNTRYEANQQNFIPECLKWNFTECDYDDCSRRHVCIHCKSNSHKGKQCKLDRDQQIRSQNQQV